MEQCNPVRNPIVPEVKLVKEDSSEKTDANLYRQMVGCLMYMAATRLDLMYVKSLVSRFMGSSSKQHMQAVKRVFCYINGTIDFGVWYRRNGSEEFVAFSDSDYAGDLDNRRITSGSVFFLSGGAVSRSSKRQPVVTLSTTEAEFVSAAASACQVVWIRRILESIGLRQEGVTILYCDNTSAINLSMNPVLHSRCKHIDVKFLYLQELMNNRVVELVYCNSEFQVADIMTKPLRLDTFTRLRRMLEVSSVSELN